MSESPITLARDLQIAINVLRVHEPENDASLNAVRQVLESIHAAFLENDECVIVVAGEQMFVNHERVRQLDEVRDLRELFGSMKIGGIVFTSPPALEPLSKFLVSLARDGEWAAPDECFVEPIDHGLKAGEGDESTVVHTYRRSIGEVRSIFHEARERGELNIRRARRAVGEVLEVLAGDENVLFGVMAIREYDLYTFQHSVNVCILSCALARRLGLDRVATRELGVAALLHDVGKLDVPRRILNKPSKLTPQEWDIMITHSPLGAQSILSQRGLDTSSMKAVEVALEHHVHYGGGGYPNLERLEKPSFFSRIVSICDCFDAMTSIRVYRQMPVTPGQAVAFIWKERGGRFDPALAKAFIGMVGAYPAGSVVRLSDGNLGVVVGGPRGEDVFRPQVKRWNEQDVLDLAAVPGLSIASSVEPGEVNVADEDVHRHLLVA